MANPIGTAIKTARRKEPFWNQKRLADEAGVGIETIVRAERGGNIRVDTLAQILSVLEKKVGDVVIGEDGSIYSADLQKEAQKSTGSVRGKRLQSPTSLQDQEGSPVDEDLAKALLGTAATFLNSRPPFIKR